MNLYSTVQGDTWDIISKKVYGTEFHTDVLLKANPEYGHILFFAADVQLTIPEIEQTQRFADLPPWKKVR